MDQVDLQEGEVVVRETKDVTVRSISLDAVLTTRNLILIDRIKKAIPRKNIPLASIRDIKPEEDAAKNPSINLSIMTENGSLRQMVISFPQLDGGKRDAECREWVQSIDERTASTRASAHVSTLTPTKTAAEVKPGVLPVDEPAVPPKARDWVPDFTPFIPKSQPETAAAPPKKSKNIMIGAAVLIVLVIIGVVLVAGPFTKGKNTAQQIPSTVTPVKTGITPLTTPSSVPTTQAPPTIAGSPTPTLPPQFIIPAKGIWVRLQSPGNYIGSVGTGGQNYDVNTTGEWVKQMSMTSGMIDGSIEKQTGSSDPLTFEVYKDGKLIAQKSTVVPQGVLDIHVTV